MTDTDTDHLHDVAIVGAGPIGIELHVALKASGVDVIHLEGRQIGFTLTWWPRNTAFFSTSERLAISGVPIQNTEQGHITAEEYLAYLRSVVEQFDLSIRSYEPVTDIVRRGEFFELHTSQAQVAHSYRARTVVLATGDMDMPNLLGIPGEDLPHVTHYFDDPHDYFRTRLLVVGGKNSAVEAALRCWRAGAKVGISYRRKTFDADRVKSHLLPDLLTQIENGNIDFLPETQPTAIEPKLVTLAKPDGEEIHYSADFVFLATGFVADMSLFQKVGVELQGIRREPVFNPESMETNVPGVFVAGTAAAGTQNRYTLFIENSHVHVGRIVKRLTGGWPTRLGTVDARTYDLPAARIQAN